MITIFNRKQLILTHDMRIQAEVRDILSDNNIDYRINPIKTGYVPARSSEAEYKIYVRKKDYEKVKYLIRTALNGTEGFVLL